MRAKCAINDLRKLEVSEKTNQYMELGLSFIVST